MHLGGVRFPLTGPIRYTMRARHVAAVCDLVQPHTTIPVHYEGWSHFREGHAAAQSALARAGEAVRSSVRWIPPGVAVEVDP